MSSGGFGGGYGGFGPAAMDPEAMKKARMARALRQRQMAPPASSMAPPPGAVSSIGGGGIGPGGMAMGVPTIPGGAPPPAAGTYPTSPLAGPPPTPPGRAAPTAPPPGYQADSTLSPRDPGNFGGGMGSGRGGGGGGRVQMGGGDALMAALNAFTGGPTPKGYRMVDPNIERDGQILSTSFANQGGKSKRPFNLPGKKR